MQQLKQLHACIVESGVESQNVSESLYSDQFA